MVSALASCAGGPGFDPRRRRGKFFVGPNTSLRVPTISRHLLYRGISISRELSSTAPPSDYLRSRRMSSSHFQQQLCKIPRILVSKFITLQKSCRKRFFIYTNWLHPSRKMSPQYIKHPLFLFSSYCDLSSRCQRSCAITRSRYLLI